MEKAQKNQEGSLLCKKFWDIRLTKALPGFSSMILIFLKTPDNSSTVLTSRLFQPDLTPVIEIISDCCRFANKRNSSPVITCLQRVFTSQGCSTVAKQKVTCQVLKEKGKYRIKLLLSILFLLFRKVKTTMFSVVLADFSETMIIEINVIILLSFS